MLGSGRAAGYRIHTEDSLRHIIDKLPQVGARLGGGAASWNIREIGDGNLNLVFRVSGPDGGVIIKQALPYLRLIGQSWPLSTARSGYEAMALQEFGRLQPGMLPAVLHTDPINAFIAMELLQPHVPLRNALLEGRRFDRLADHLSTYLANTLFRTSESFLSAPGTAALMSRYAGNHEMAAVTDTLVFTDPFMSCPRNRWTSPELDPLVAELKEDEALQLRVQALRQRFLNTPQALLHGDLHTSSIMVTSTDTRIIDPEFVGYGPIGFDVGLLLGDLLLSYFAQAGHQPDAPAEQDYAEWILELVEATWLEFIRKFSELDAQSQSGQMPAPGNDATRVHCRDVFQDAAGFAAIEMTRRILGLAHVIDFELIPDRTMRSACERAALLVSRWILRSDGCCDSIHAITGMARRIFATI